ncbi:hypothetical protein M5689_004565 [Euphorbia peplus]|nr:hypothetical protein M5689_004565 [Euphorbia peplus]
MARNKAPDPIPAVKGSSILTKFVSSPPPPPTTTSEAKIPLEEDQKQVVLVEKMTSNNKASVHEEKSKLVNGVIKQLKKIDLDYEDGVKRDIITLSGANEGARMKIVNYKKDKRVKGRRERSTVTFINSNVEGINNSIVGNSSCTYHNPGIHASLFTNHD